MTRVFFEDVPADHSTDEKFDIKSVREQAALSRGRELPMLSLDHQGVLRDSPVAIIGGGPTLRDDLGGVTRLQQLDARRDVIKVLAGSAHRFLDNNQLVNGADIGVFTSPDEEFKDIIGATDHDIEYWASSLCHPAFLDKLPPEDTYLWNACLPGVDYPKDEWAIGAGSTSVIPAVTLLIQMGHRDFEFFGVDGGSFDALPEDYAYDMTDFTENPEFSAAFRDHVVVRVGTQTIKVQTKFWRQAQEMQRIINSELGRQCRFTFHGDSLNNMLFNRGFTPQLVADFGAAEPGFEPS